MALLKGLQKISKPLNIFRSSFAFSYTTSNESSNGIEKIDNDMPVEMENPFVEEKPKCILCRYDIEPTYKNVRLLSQFVSRHTGRIYGRHITGLCEHKQKKVEAEIRKARICGLMGSYTKEPNYLADPSLYNEMNPLRPHKYI